MKVMEGVTLVVASSALNIKKPYHVNKRSQDQKLQ
jgi:hypothetical protein